MSTLRSKIRFELCCADIRSVQLAEEYKLEAIEICVDLSCGGLTPSLEFIKKSRSIFHSELAVLFRIRKGDFVYSAVEKEIMLADMKSAINCGVDTVVFGGLKSDHTIDSEFVEQVINYTSGVKLCFHKAFDQSNDLLPSLQILQYYQIDRVLTAGGKGTALEEKKNLKLLVDHCSNQIEIMAGGSIDATNANEIIHYSGVQRIHAALLDNSENKNKYGTLEIASRKKLEELIMCIQAV